MTLGFCTPLPTHGPRSAQVTPGPRTASLNRRCHGEARRRASTARVPAGSAAELDEYFAATTSNSEPDLRRCRALLDRLSIGNVQLLVAARMGDHEMVGELLDGGDVDVNVQDVEGSTPLMRSASRGYVLVVEALLRTNNVDMAMKNNWGYDATMYLGSVKNSKPAEFKNMADLFLQYCPETDLSRVDLRWTAQGKSK